MQRRKVILTHSAGSRNLMTPLATSVAFPLPSQLICFFNSAAFSLPSKKQTQFQPLTPTALVCSDTYLGRSLEALKMNRMFMFFGGLLLMCSLSGCCLMHGMGMGYGGGYPGAFGGGGGGCGSCGGGCGVAPGGYPSGALSNGVPSTAFAPGYPQAAFAPGYPQTAFAPIQALPTY